MRPQILSVTIAALLGTVSGVEWDNTWSGHSVAFGSCNRVFPKGGGSLTQQPLWEKMIEKNIEAFYWIGDAVYPLKHNNDSSLGEALEAQLTHPQYQKLLQSVPRIDGTWDDHDRGANDQGYIKESGDIQNMFLDFLQLSKSSPRRSRDGVYSAHKITNPSNSSQAVGVILLDTRSHREPFAIEQVIPIGEIHPIVSVISRLLSALLGMNDGGDVLGSQQWKWLSDILQEPLDAFIVVSSIQVNTSIPLVESWGHFASSQQRLLSMLNNTNSVQLISGDVHYAEAGFHEITTSGMTHTCQTQFPVFCDSVLKRFTSHRPDTEGYFTGYNYLHLDIDWSGSVLQFSVLDDTNRPQISRTVPLRSPTLLLPASKLVNYFWLVCATSFLLLTLLVRSCCISASKKKSE